MRSQFPSLDPSALAAASTAAWSSNSGAYGGAAGAATNGSSPCSSGGADQVPCFATSYSARMPRSGGKWQPQPAGGRRKEESCECAGRPASGGWRRRKSGESRVFDRPRSIQRVPNRAAVEEVLQFNEWVVEPSSGVEAAAAPAAPSPAASGAAPNGESESRPLNASERAVLYAATDLRDGSCKMVKVIKKTRLPASSGGDKLWRRLCGKLLRLTVAHRGLMHVSDVFETPEEYLIVSERLSGGELFEFLLTERAVPEELCKYITRQVLHAVHFLHSHALLHRDLKPENIMFRQRRRRARGAALSSLECSQTMAAAELHAQFELAMIDFDTCKMTDIPAAAYPEVLNGRRRLVGTYGYLAPEVLKGHEYTAASDLWSVGVILYILMTGVPPVPMEQMNSAKSALQVLHDVRREGIDFRVSPLPEFPAAQHLCRCLLEFEPSRRLGSAALALSHPWLYAPPSNFLRPPTSKSARAGGAFSTVACGAAAGAAGGAGGGAGGSFYGAPGLRGSFYDVPGAGGGGGSFCGSPGGGSGYHSKAPPPTTAASFFHPPGRWQQVGSAADLVPGAKAERARGGCS